MQFNSEEARLAHPLASLISKKIWDEVFHQKLPEYCLAFMTEQNEEVLLTQLHAFHYSRVHDVRDEKRIKLFFSIVSSHPNLNPNSLEKLFEQFAPSFILNLALQWGNRAFIDHLIQKYKEKGSLQALLMEEVCKLLYRAIEEGPLELWTQLLQELPFLPQDSLRFLDIEALKRAARGGQLESLKYLIAQAPQDLQASFRAQAFTIMEKAVDTGELEVLKYLLELMPQQFKADNWTLKVLFVNAAQKGQLEVLKFLFTKLPRNQVKKLIRTDNYQLFRAAAIAGHMEVLEFLVEKAPRALASMLRSKNPGSGFDTYEAFTKAAERGHLEVLQYFVKKAPHKSQIRTWVGPQNDHPAFRRAAESGHLEILKYLLSLVERNPNQVKSMIQAGHYCAFREAANSGHLEVLKYLVEKAPLEVSAMIETWEYTSFIKAAKSGHLEVLKFLVEKAPQQALAMIRSRDYEAFRSAAFSGHLEVLKYLAEMAPQEVPLMLSSNSYRAFSNAAGSGQLECLKYLVELAPQDTLAMIKTKNYYDDFEEAPYDAFREAAEAGSLEILRYLEEKAPQELLAMIQADNYGAFRNAALKGHLPVLKYLREKAPQALNEESYADLMRWVAENGHLEVLAYLAEQAPQVFHNENRSGRLLRAAFASPPSIRPQHIIMYLLKDPLAFAYAEQHQFECRLFIVPLVNQKLAALKQQKQDFETANPNGVFNVTEEEAAYLFYILRQLIRRNEVLCLDDMRLLLSLPQVKGLAVGGARPNELLRLALSLNNGPAAGLLLQLPSVRELAEQNNYYRAEMHAGLDFQALSQDRESAMLALTQGEQARLNAAAARYEPLLRAKGVAVVMDELRSLLKDRYLLSPAQIEIEEEGQKRKLSLPLEWEAFQNMNLNAAQRQAALEAYYQNKNHTALRYLSRPNSWMHPQASYVHTSADNLQRWSTFEEYQPLIGMLFLAAKDAESEPIEQFTLETRLEHFIAELALIGRSHNWDNSRPKLDSAGKPLLDEHDQLILEEYDDLEGDRPTCYSGVKRRLFQSLPGHALFQVLTLETIKSELRDFVRSHFNSLINQSNKEKYTKAWNLLIEGDQEGIVQLKELDINEAQQKNLLQFLNNKYGSAFTGDPVLTKEVERAFFLDPNIEDCHFIRFGSANPELFLGTSKQEGEQFEERMPAPSLGHSSVQLRIFSGLIAVLGLVAVALAFTVLNAATLGITGLVLASIGGAAALSGLGLFAKSFYKKKAVEEVYIDELEIEPLTAAL